MDVKSTEHRDKLMGDLKGKGEFTEGNGAVPGGSQSNEG